MKSGKLTVIIIDDQNPEMKMVRVIPYKEYTIDMEEPVMIDATTFGSTKRSYLVGHEGSMRISYVPEKEGNPI